MKSHESDQIRLLRCVLEDTRRQCTAYVSFRRDLSTLIDRFEHEGLSFLTITLPDFAKDFERSLAVGLMDPSCFRGWRKCALPGRAGLLQSGQRHGQIPAFLQGITGQLFDPETGRLKDVPPSLSSTFVAAVRQVCLLFKKVEASCSPEREEKAFEGYVSTERSFDDFSPSSHLRDLFGHVSDILWSPVLLGINPLELTPRHGPGQTAEGISGNSKYHQISWHERLEPFFPYFGSAVPLGAADLGKLGSLDLSEPSVALTGTRRKPINPLLAKQFEEGDYSSVSFLSEHQESPVRVISVPKTLKGPRIIAIEPVCMQFAQQAIRDVLYERIESTWPMSGRVNFTRQDFNQKIALSSSGDGTCATVDLSEASDRVPLDLALRMFDSNPDLRDAIASCRSLTAAVPGGDVISLRKFASMGSALCFPVEAMYFYTICVVSLLRIQNLSMTRDNVNKVARLVYVYGDDIIIPREHAVAVLDYLQEFNCKVNLSKTFWNGKFRESCGMDAYDGYPVTPVYLRKLNPESRQQADRIISWVATAHLFYKRGYWVTAEFLYREVERFLGPLPYVSDDSGALGRITFLGGRTVHRWNQRYQRFEVRAWVAKPIYRTDRIGGFAALAKSLTGLERAYSSDASDQKLFGRSLPTRFSPREVDKYHLERTARFGAVALTRRWHPS